MMAIQTNFPLAPNREYTFPESNDNVYMLLNALCDAEIVPAVVPSRSIRLAGGRIVAEGFVVDPRRGQAHAQNRTFRIGDRVTIHLDDLDALFIRGDDLADNPQLDGLMPRIDAARVYMPIDYTELKATTDKWDTARRFCDLSIPETYYAERAEDLHGNILRLFDRPGHRYAVLKHRFGFGGKSVVRLDKEDPGWSAQADLFLERHRQVVIQEYDPAVAENDIRAIVYGGKYIGAFERKSGEGQWLTNISSGGTAVAHEPLPGEVALCEEIARRFPKIKYLGIDLFKSLRLIEVNGFSGGSAEMEDFFGFPLMRNLVEDALRNALRSGAEHGKAHARP